MVTYKVEKEVSVKFDAKQMKVTINTILDMAFNNIEGILDFSWCRSHKGVDSKQLKNLPPQHHKLIAKKYNQKLAVCGAKFWMMIMRRNKQTAYKERRFQYVCERKFIQSTHLHNRMRVYTGVKPYCCEIYRKRFSRIDL